MRARTGHPEPAHGRRRLPGVGRPDPPRADGGGAQLRRPGGPAPAARHARPDRRAPRPAPARQALTGRNRARRPRFAGAGASCPMLATLPTDSRWWAGTVRRSKSPSSSGLGLRPFKAAARVRIPLGVRQYEFGPVAQLVSASPCHGEGRGFESRLGRSIPVLGVGARPGSSVGTSDRLKSGRSAVRPRPWPPPSHQRKRCLPVLIVIGPSQFPSHSGPTGTRPAGWRCRCGVRPSRAGSASPSELCDQPMNSITARSGTPRRRLVASNVPTAGMVRVDQWQVDPHRKRGNALRSGSDAAAGLWRCIRCNNPAVDAKKSDATSWHPMQPRMVITWSGARRAAHEPRP